MTDSVTPEQLARNESETLGITGLQPGQHFDPLGDVLRARYEELLRDGLPPGGVTETLRELFTPEQLAAIPVRPAP